MKKTFNLLLMLVIAATIFVSCTAEIVGIDGTKYHPDALLVHDQSSPFMWVAYIIIIIMLFVIAKRIKHLTSVLQNKIVTVTPTRLGKLDGVIGSGVENKSNTCETCGVIIDPGKKHCSLHSS